MEDADENRRRDDLVRVEGPLRRLPLRRILETHWPFACLLLLLLVAGLVLGNDFGMSLDEARNAQVGELALQAYSGSMAYFSEPGTLNFGPAYFMLFSLVGQWVHAIAPAWTIADGHHLANYVTFLIGVCSLYVLCFRFMRPSFAAFTVALFATQPVVFGYAFINQKDIPFMSFFLLSVVLGMMAADSLASQGRGRIEAQAKPSRFGPKAAWQGIRREWSAASRRRKRVAILAPAFGVVVALDLTFVGLFQRALQALLSLIYDSNALPFFRGALSVVAGNTDSAALPYYVAKLDKAFAYFSGIVALALLILAAVAASRALPALGKVWGLDLNAWRNPWLVATGIALGLTICTRQVGAFAFALIGLWMLVWLGGKAIAPMLVVGLAAAIVTTLTWPYLWRNPYGEFVDSLRLAAGFSEHITRFWGNAYWSSELPWTFFPTMAGIELTEPAVLLAIVGMLAAIFWLRKRDRQSAWSLALIWLWLGVPLLLLFFSNLKIYGNVRHLLFIFPALFVLCGIAAQATIGRLSIQWIKALFALAIIAPGLMAIASLHPYEYIYYNSLVGGVRGAAGQFEIDRWCTSLREGIEVLDRIAPRGASVAIPTSSHQVEPYARQDLVLAYESEVSSDPDYVLSCAYRDKQSWENEGYSEIYRITRDGVVLTTVWARRSQE